MNLMHWVFLNISHRHKVLEKVGMIREGRKRQVLPLKSGWSDNYEYAMLHTDIRRINSQAK